MADKLVGSAPQQVPTNADLGNAAYQDMEDIFHRGNFFKASTAEAEGGLDTEKYMTPDAVRYAMRQHGLGDDVDLRGTVFETGTPTDLHGTGTTFGFSCAGPAHLAISGYTNSDYGSLITNAQWSNGTGNEAFNQIFICDRIWTRESPDGATWNPWKEIHTSNTGTSTAEAQTGTDTTKWMSAKTVMDKLKYHGLQSTLPTTTDRGYALDLNVINDKSGEYTMSGSYANGPSGTTSYTGLLKVMYRHFGAGASCRQELTLTNNVYWYRTGTGVAGSMTWDPWVSVLHSGYQGSGSGIDSDLLDGLHAASFMRTDQDSTSTGYQKAEGFVSGDSGDANKTVSIMYPGGGSDDPAGATMTGAIKVTLPVSWTHHMIQFTVSVYDHATHESFKVHISGFNSTTGSSWSNTAPMIIGSPEMDRDLTVRYGHDGTKCCVYIGELADVWDYPLVTVQDVILGHTSLNISDWSDGWVVGFEDTAFGTITATHLKTQVGRYIEGSEVVRKDTILNDVKAVDGIGSGIDADMVDGFHASNLCKISSDNYTTANQIASNGKGYWGRNAANTTSHHIAQITPADELQVGNNNIPIRLLTNGTITHNGNKVWHAGNDGAGSGLDADMIDGLGSADFVRYGATGTLNNSLASGAWVTGYADANNIDHIWFDDGANVWHFCSDTTFKDQGNATVKAGAFNEGGTNLSAKYLGITAKAADSDKLDNLNSTQFLRSDTGDVKTSGSLRFNDSVYLTLGTGNDIEHHCNGTNYYTDINGGMNWYIRDGNSSNAVRFTLDADLGDFTATGDVTGLSDRRLKKNLSQITDAIDTVDQLTGYVYDRIDIDKRQTGLVAQDVQKVLPEAVSVADDEQGTLSIAYGQMMGYAIECIKSLKSMFKRHDDEIKVLQEQVKALQEALAERDGV